MDVTEKQLTILKEVDILTKELFEVMVKNNHLSKGHRLLAIRNLLAICANDAFTDKAERNQAVLSLLQDIVTGDMGLNIS